MLAQKYIFSLPITKMKIQNLNGCITPSSTNWRSYTDVPIRLQPVKIAYASYESAFADEEERKPPILIMHGLLGSKNNWNTLAKSLHSKTRRKIIAVDARNHGDSPHTNEFSYPHLAEDVYQLVEDLNIPQMTAVGHSMGGRVMMFLALKYPHLIESLIVVDISPVRTSSDIKQMTNLFNAMNSVDLDLELPISKARKIVDEQLAEFVPDLYIRQFLLTNLVQVPGGTYKWRVNLDSIVQNFQNIIRFPIPGGVYRGPALFIGGKNSNYLRPEDHRSIRKLFPNAEFRYIDDAGHWVHTEKPNEFLSHLCSFVNSS